MYSEPWGLYTLTGKEVVPEGHVGHEIHNHAAHAGVTLCECGEIMGSYSFVVDKEWDIDPCPICVKRLNNV